MATPQNRDLFTSRIVPIMESVRERIGVHWFKEFFSPTSTEEYINMVKSELQKQHINVDLATERKMIDYLINKNVPESSIEYILKSSGKQTLFYLPRKLQHSELDEYIDKKATEKYNPSLGEELTSIGLGLTADLVTTWGASSYLTTAKLAKTGISLAIGGADYAIRSYSDKKSEGQEKRDAIYQKSIASASKTRHIPEWMLAQNHFSNWQSASVEQLQKAQAWAVKNSKVFHDKVEKCVREGNDRIYVGKKVYTAEECSVRARQYDLFINATKSQLEYLQADKKRVSVPHWMLQKFGISKLSEATDEQLYEMKSWADRTSKNMRKAIEDNIPNGVRCLKFNNKSVYNIASATQRSKEYELLSSNIEREITSRTEEREGRLSLASESQDNAEQGTSEQKTGDYSGWNLFSSLLGDNASHLGYKISMLPDMLLGLLTGKTQSVGFNKDTLIPLAALMSGTFIKNPLLKLPLMLYGGASIFSMLGNEAVSEKKGMEKSNETVGKYKKYEDEALDPRIKNPQIEGSALLVEIDKKQKVITLPPVLIEAYNQGAVPINVIANRVLSRMNELSESENISSSVKYSETIQRSQEQSRGIR